MPAWPKRPLVLFLIFALCLANSPAAQAQIAGVRKAKAIPVILGVVAAGVLIGYGVYLAVHHGHSLRGCAATAGGGGGMQVLNEGDHQAYPLTGDAGGVQAGHRVRVSGNKGRDAGGQRSFAVKHLSKDYGACLAQP